MDITLIKTFIEVANTGSFVAASERLFVTQSAVSLRIQRLEDSLGQPLFTRSKAGAILTPSGAQFERYALSMLRVWEESRQQVGIPEGFSRTLTIGAQRSLWPRLGFRWIDGLRVRMPDLSISTKTGDAEHLTRLLIEGVMHMALMYSPQLRPGLIIEKALDDELILVASFQNATADLAADYVYVDWGPEFTHSHAICLPHLTDSGLTMGIGGQTADFIVNRHAMAYLPARAVKRSLDAKTLHIVPDAPRFPYPSWSVRRDDMAEDLCAIARETLADVTQRAEIEQEKIVEGLETMEEYDPV